MESNQQYEYITYNSLSIHIFTCFNLHYIFLLQSPELETLLNSFPQLETHKLNVSFLSSDAIHWACSYGVEPDIENIQSKEYLVLVVAAPAVHGHGVGPGVVDGQNVPILGGRQLHILGLIVALETQGSCHIHHDGRASLQCITVFFCHFEQISIPFLCP